MKQSHITILFLTTFILTTFLLRWWQSSPLLLWQLTGLCVVIVALGIVASRQWEHRYKDLISIIIVTVCAIALSELTVVLHPPNEAFIQQIRSIEHQQITAIGTIGREPDRRPMQTKYTVDVTAIRTASGRMITVVGRLLATDRNQWPEYAYGDWVAVFGAVELPGMVNDFDYQAYLALDDVSAVIQRAGLSIIQRFSDRPASAYERLLSALYGMKGSFEMQINRVFPEPDASLLTGILTGSRRGIPADLTTDFQITGLTHIIAISGYNITVILALLSGLLFWLPLKWRTVPLALGIIFFTLLVGASASVVRAAIMGVLGLIALHTGKQRTERLIVLWTAFVMIVWNPLSLWYDSGFQLSFLAVIGIMELSPWLQKVFKSVPDIFALRTSLVATIAAQIATLPVTTVIFGRFSFIAPLSNILVAPLVPMAMLLGFIGTTISWFFFPLGQMISFAAFGFLELIILISHILAQVPLASISL